MTTIQEILEWLELAFTKTCYEYEEAWEYSEDFGPDYADLLPEDLVGLTLEDFSFVKIQESLECNSFIFSFKHNQEIVYIGYDYSPNPMEDDEVLSDWKQYFPKLEVRYYDQLSDSGPTE